MLLPKHDVFSSPAKSLIRQQSYRSGSNNQRMRHSLVLVAVYFRTNAISGGTICTISWPAPSEVYPPKEILCLSLSLCLPLSMSLYSSMLLCMSLSSSPIQLLMRVHTILRYQVCGVCAIIIIIVFLCLIVIEFWFELVFAYFMYN